MSPLIKVCAAFLLALSWASSSVAGVRTGEVLPDLTMRTQSGWPLNLKEQAGKPVMLIWLDDCDACTEDLISWQYLAESHAVEDLVTWFVWRPEEGDQPPETRLPVLKYTGEGNSWWYEKAPAVMLISPDGVLNHLFTDDIEDNQQQIGETLGRWLEEKHWLADETSFRPGV